MSDTAQQPAPAERPAEITIAWSQLFHWMRPTVDAQQTGRDAEHIINHLAGFDSTRSEDELAILFALSQGFRLVRDPDGAALVEWQAYLYDRAQEARPPFRVDPELVDRMANRERRLRELDAGELRGFPHSLGPSTKVYAAV